MRKSKRYREPVLSEKSQDQITRGLVEMICSRLSEEEVHNMYLLHNEIGIDEYVSTFNDRLNNANENDEEKLKDIVALIKEGVTKFGKEMDEKIRSDLQGLSQTKNDVKTSKVNEKKEFKCLLCGSTYKSKQKLHNHYENTCKNKSLMTDLKTKNFDYDPISISQEEVNLIMIMIMEYDINDLNSMEDMLIELLHREFFDHHIEKNNNIYIGNKNYEVKFYIIKDGIWKKEGNLDLLRNRVIELFTNLSKCMIKGIRESENRDNLAAMWEKITWLFNNTKKIQTHITKLLFNEIQKNESMLRQKYDESFQY
jgi:hypothetical protein